MADPADGRTLTRALVLVALMLAAVAALVVANRRAAPLDSPRLVWLADAHQFGPVGYRDPAGAISPDGQWIAYSEGRFLRVRPSGGGPSVAFPAGAAQIRTLAWSPDSRTVLTDGYLVPGGWALYDRLDGTRRALWPEHDPLSATRGDGTSTHTRVADLRQLSWSPDGQSLAGLAAARDGQELWTIAADASSAHVERMAQRVAFPAWTSSGELACVATVNGKARVTIPCGGSTLRTDPDLDVNGPIAFAPDGRTVYVSFANPSGTLDLWAAPRAGGAAVRLTGFSRDSYAPSITADGSVSFKVQSYRTVVAVAPAEGGASRSVATFQSETPSWDPSGKLLGITFGTWRRIVDDAKYPDIAQDAGVIAVDPLHPADRPSQIVHASVSEDQALCWSPNGKWIAFHSHKDQSDDIFLRPASGAGDVAARRLSFLGRGAEAGWPRWSPDGRWLLFDGASRTTHRSVMFVIGIDQDSGATTREAQEVTVDGFDADVSHAEWLPDSARVAVVAKEGPGRHVIFTVGRDGGSAQVVHRLESEHDSPGLAVSPDGHDVAFVAPGAGGFFQVFRMPIAGGTPVAITNDWSNKTQPAWSPDGRSIAFTVWNYDAQFWRTR
ncbi:MAG TPA: hypothetical protein VGH34_09395 [Vicinamibacterales bacterium]